MSAATTAMTTAGAATRFTSQGYARTRITRSNCGRSSVGRASASQAGRPASDNGRQSNRHAAVAQLVERELPKLEVAGSRPVRRFWLASALRPTQQSQALGGDARTSRKAQLMRRGPSLLRVVQGGRLSAPIETATLSPERNSRRKCSVVFEGSNRGHHDCSGVVAAAVSVAIAGGETARTARRHRRTPHQIDAVGAGPVGRARRPAAVLSRRGGGLARLGTRPSP